MQYNTIQYNTIHNTIQYNTIGDSFAAGTTDGPGAFDFKQVLQYNTIQYNTIQYNTIQYKTKQSIVQLYLIAVSD